MGRCSINRTRLPHSEIPGSERACRYPRLIAAYHVLHRLLAPRHSPCAFNSLSFSSKFLWLTLFLIFHSNEVSLIEIVTHNAVVKEPRTFHVPPAVFFSPFSALLHRHCFRTSTGGLVGLTGLEPVTPALSRRCSNQLSYRPPKRPLQWRHQDGDTLWRQGDSNS